MSWGHYLAGLAFFGLTLGPVAVSARLVVRAVFGALQGAPRVLAYAMLVTLGLMAVHLLPGMLGLLHRGVVAGTALALCAATAAWTRGRTYRHEGAPDEVRPPAAGRAERALAAAAAGIAVAYLGSLLLLRLPEPVEAIDTLSFEGPALARWIQDGTLWPIAHFVPLWAFGNYPQNGALVELAVVLPWHGEGWLRASMSVYHLLLGVAVYALAIELRASWPAAVAWAAVAAVLPAGALAAVEYVKTDPMMHAAFVTAVLFAVRHSRTRARSDLVMAGLSLGVAFGTKWYGVSYAVAAVGVWLLARLLARTPVRSVLTDTGLVAALVSLSGGFWLIRNLIGSGNPVYPVKVEIAGLTLFDAPFDRVREQIGFSLVDYLGEWDLWERLIVPALRDSFGIAGLVLMIAALLAAVLSLARRERRRSAATGAVAVLALAVAAIYASTPYSAQGESGDPALVAAAVRYAVPAVALAAAVAASLSARAGRWAVAAQALALVLVVDGLRGFHDLSGLGEVLDVITPIRVAVLAAVIGLVAAATHGGTRGSAAVRVPAFVLLALLVVLGGRAQQDDYHTDRYVGLDPSIDYVLSHASSGNRIGLFGRPSPAQFSPMLPLLGPRYGNRVRYLGPVQGDTLQEIATEADVRTQLQGRDLDLVFVMRPGAAVVREERWVLDAGFEQVARGPTSTLFATP